MAVEKKFDTRILLKYDSLSNWNSSSLILKAGEVAIATVPSTDDVTKSAEGVITPPAAVVIKVGDGASTFAQLPIISALAADVYGWAKKSEAEFKDWLDKTAGFATDTELANVKAALDAKDKTLEELIAQIEGGGEGGESLTDLYTSVNALKTVLSSFMPANGESAENDAVKTAIDAVADAVATLRSDMTDADATLGAKIAALESTVNGTEEADGLVDDVAALKSGLSTAQQDIVDINAAIGEVAEGKNVVGMISEAEAAAKKYTDDELAEVSAAVEENTAAIATLNGTGEGSIHKTVADEIANVVANAPEDFDTLKEIADWIANDTTGAAGMANDIADLIERADAVDTGIASLQENISDLEAADKDLSDRIDAIVGEGSTGTLAALEARVSTAETDITNLKSKDDELAGSIQTLDAAVKAVKATADQNVLDIAGEVSRATEAEGSLLSSLNSEITRATDAEAALDARINALAAEKTYINDIEQKENTEIILDCGSSAIRVTAVE